MKHDPDIAARGSRKPTVADFTRAKAGYAAGGGVDHIVVGQWLLTWGQPGQKPFADWLRELASERAGGTGRSHSVHQTIRSEGRPGDR